MKKEARKLFGHVWPIFFAIVFSNILVDYLDGSDIRFFQKPLLFLGTTIGLSLIGGYLIFKLDERAMKKKGEINIRLIWRSM